MQIHSNVLDSNSPYLQESDSLDTPYSPDHKDGLNYDTVHICKDLTAENLNNVIAYLLKSNLELRREIVKSEKKTMDYARGAGITTAR
jgi:hypothetical protein